MRTGTILGVFASVGIATGCAGIDRAPPRQTPGLRCADIAGHGVAAGPGEARALAENDIAHQVTDIRGYLLNSGARHIRPGTSKISCRPFVLGGELTQCVIVKRYCGH